MHKLLLDQVVASVRRRVEQGDCPVEPAQSVEMLENAILDLATPPKQGEDAVRDALEEAARTAYRICAEARHVSLGDKVTSAILAALSANQSGADAGKDVRYAAIGETSTEGPRWYIWKSGQGTNYVGGAIADKQSADAIAAELNRLAASPAHTALSDSAGGGK